MRRNWRPSGSVVLVATGPGVWRAEGLALLAPASMRRTLAECSSISEVLPEAVRADGLTVLEWALTSDWAASTMASSKRRSSPRRVLRRAVSLAVRRSIACAFLSAMGEPSFRVVLLAGLVF